MAIHDESRSGVLALLSKSQALYILKQLESRDATRSEISGGASRAVVQDRLTELSQAGIIESTDEAWRLTIAGHSLMAALGPILAWEERYIGKEPMSRDVFLMRVGNTIRVLTGREPRHQGVEVVGELAEASLSVSCVGGARIATQLVTDSQQVTDQLRSASEHAPSTIGGLLRSEGRGSRWSLGIEWLLASEDYRSHLVQVDAALEWLVRFTKPSEGELMNKADFLRWVEGYMNVCGKGKVVGVPDRHYRTVNVGRYRHLGIDALETGKEAPLIRVHILTSHSEIASNWSTVEPPGPFPDGLKPEHRPGARKGGRQHYFGFAWSNNPINYSRWLPRVKTSADYLVSLVKDGLL